MTTQSDDATTPTPEPPYETTDVIEYLNSLDKEDSKGAPRLNFNKDRIFGLMIANLESIGQHDLAVEIENLGFAASWRLYDYFLDNPRRNANDPNPRNVRALIRILNQISQSIEIVNKQLAINAIKKGSITRRAAAEAFGVHENTMARWVKEDDFIQQVIREDGPLVFITAIAEFFGKKNFFTTMEHSRTTKTPAVDIFLGAVKAAHMGIDKWLDDHDS